MEFSWTQPWLMSVNIFDPHAAFDPPADYLARYNPDELPGPAFEPSDLAAQELLKGVDFQNAARDPESFDARGKIAAYYAMIELIDHNVGRMLDALERTGQAANTLVIFTSDHGEMLGDHGLLLKGCRFYEGLVHVPLILRWPGHIAAGVTTDALSSSPISPRRCSTPPACRRRSTWRAARCCRCCAAPPPSTATRCAANTTRRCAV